MKKNLITSKALYHRSLSPSAGDVAHIHVDRKVSVTITRGSGIVMGVLHVIRH